MFFTIMEKRENLDNMQKIIEARKQKIDSTKNLAELFKLKVLIKTPSDKYFQGHKNFY